MVTVSHVIVLSPSSCNIFFSMPDGEGWCTLPNAWIEMQDGRDLSRCTLDEIERALYAAIKKPDLRYLDCNLEPVSVQDLRWCIPHWRGVLATFCDQHSQSLA